MKTLTKMIKPQWPKPIRWLAAATIGAAVSFTLYMLLYYACVLPLARWRWRVQYAETGTEPSAQIWVGGILMAMMPLGALLAGLVSALSERSNDSKFLMSLSLVYGIASLVFLRRFPVFAAVFVIAAFLGCYWGQRLLQRPTRRSGKSRHH